MGGIDSSEYKFNLKYFSTTLLERKNAQIENLCYLLNVFNGKRYFQKEINRNLKQRLVICLFLSSAVADR